VQGGLFDLCFFNKTINCERYVKVILGKFFLGITEEEKLHGCLQQDSATARTVCLSMQAVTDIFRERIINNGLWQDHSLKLNPCNFFFWGCLKDKVYKTNH
jgi:hypothetical protein